MGVGRTSIVRLIAFFTNLKADKRQGRKRSQLCNITFQTNSLRSHFRHHCLPNKYVKVMLTSCLENFLQIEQKTAPEIPLAVIVVVVDDGRESSRCAQSVAVSSRSKVQPMPAGGVTLI
jgi:hypothetical protein